MGAAGYNGSRRAPSGAVDGGAGPRLPRPSRTRPSGRGRRAMNRVPGAADDRCRIEECHLAVGDDKRVVLHAASSLRGGRLAPSSVAVDALPSQPVERLVQRLLAEAAVAPGLDVGMRPARACAQTQSFVTPRRSATSSTVRRRVTRTQAVEALLRAIRRHDDRFGDKLVPNWCLASRRPPRSGHKKGPAMQGLSRIAGAGFEPATFGL